MIRDEQKDINLHIEQYNCIWSYIKLIAERDKLPSKEKKSNRILY